MKQRMSLVWAVALCLGCQPEAPIEVSGGVLQPGAYAYRPDWTASDYINAAGGYADEALESAAHLVRGIVDSTDKNQIWQLHLPLAENPDIMPGDAIRVPVRTYSVRLDTVRLVRDLRLVYERVLLKMARGALVAGWTERGAVVAMLMGRGEVYDLPDTTKVASGFHYLYLHLHPDQYTRIQDFVGEVVDSLEAMEDAREIHKTAFPRCDHQIEGAAELPPEGYFRVLRGVLYTPRSAANPGRGMRKRYYEDGRIWTTFPDGRQRWQHPDGRVTITFASGQKEERFPDGRIAQTNLQGHVQTIHPDGREEWAMASSPSPGRPPASRVRPPAGHTRLHQIFPDGRIQWQEPDGSISETRPSPKSHPIPDIPDIPPDNPAIAVSSFGHRIETFADGRRTLAMPPAYAYPGYLQTSLVEIIPMPDRLPVNGDLVVEGHLSDGVQNVTVSAFQVPDGDVIPAHLTRKDRAFRGRFRFGEKGHYRIQVQAELWALHMVTAAHHAVQVGDTGALSPVVLSLGPYPGDESAARILIDQINAARKSLSRETLLPHPELMTVARIRLEEMLEKGEVSHVSKTGKTVSWHIRHRGIGVKRTGENVASARFLETLHPNWMLSAGHRGNILAKHWTHVGAAATRLGDDVWAVQIFGAF